MACAVTKPFCGLLGTVLAIPLLAGPVGAQQPAVQAGGELPGKAMLQIKELLEAKAQRTPAQRKVISQLLDAARQPPEPTVSDRQQAADTDPAAEPEPVMVDIRADVTPAVLERIRALGGAVVNSIPKYQTIRARLPLTALEPLATLEAVQFIRPADQPITDQVLERSDVARAVVATSKVNTSEGDVAHQANVARQTYNVDGTGIGIGVISDGVETLAAQQATGDVPAPVLVLPGQAGGSFPLACGGRSSGTEGTAMLEIVHDLAPGAELFFADGGGGPAQMAQNIENLCAAGANIIVDDIGYLRASAFQDDVISQAISAAAANGCYYFSSAGNAGNLNDGTAGVWEGDFAAGGTLSVNGVPVGSAHDFGGGVTGNRIKTSSTRPIVMQWADPVGGSANDYDLFLIDADNNVLASSTNTQDGTQDPIEFIGGSCSGDYKDARLVVVKTTGAADRYVRLNYARGGLEIATAGQTFGHSASKDAVGVAAVAASSGSAFDGTESVETFSSDGPRRIFFESDGTPITPGNFSATGGRVLQKPDLAAADAVSTSTPGFSTFRGTSAAAPHAAAIAALMLEAAGGPANVTPAALRTAMTGAALDIEVTGVDRDSGAGIVMAPGAVDAVDVAAADRNGVPTATGTLTAGTMAPGGAAVTIDVASAFSDPDNDTLTYTALSGDPNRVEVTVSGSMLTLTPKVPGVVPVTVRAVDSHGLSVTLTFSASVAAGTRDYDVDDDGLIAVATLGQLDAMRYDLNGDGMVDVASDWQSYYAAFEQGAISMGCPDGCTGYELTANVDFDTDGSGSPDAGDDYWNGGGGWEPIGGDGTVASGTQVLLRNPFNAIFEGNGRTVSNLFIDTDTIVLAGLFGYAASEIRNVGLIDVDVTGTELAAGLVGFNAGEIRASYVVGRVSGGENVGGLVGINNSQGGIRGSYAASGVSGDDDVGGLVGDNRGEITAAYATGPVSGKSGTGGLVGSNKSTGEIRAAYATGPVSGDSDVGGLVGAFEGGRVIASYWDTNTSGRTTSALGTARTTAQLQAPRGYSGIYGSWNLDLDGDNAADDPWDFGTASRYPALSVDTNAIGGATWEEFGYQLREGPTLTAAPEETRVSLDWNAVAASHWSPAPGVAYTLYRDDGAAVETLVENTGNRAFIDTGVIVGAAYAYQVAAVVSGGETTRSGWLSVRVPDTTAPRVLFVAMTSDPGTDRTYATDEEIELTLTFDEAVTVRGAPQLKLEVGDEDRMAGYVGGSGTDALVFGYKVTDGESDSGGVSVPADSIDLNRGAIADGSNNPAVLTHGAVSPQSGHRVDGVRPVLEDTGGAVINGSILTLTYVEPLDGGSTPPASAYTVRGGSRARTVSDVLVSGRAVILTLDPAVEHGEEGIRVSYRAPSGASPVRDVPGNPAAGLSSEPVTNETPDTTAPTVDSVEISSDPGTDRTYAAGDEIRVAVAFSESVKVEGTPRLQIEFGGGRRTANYRGGGGTAALVFGYPVAEGESDDDGVGVEADSLTRGGGTIRDDGDNDAVLAHDAVAADVGHMVDGVQPELAVSGGAVIDGTTLTLTYDETLDPRSAPEPGDFTIAGGDHARAVTRVSVTSAMVRLTLNPRAEHNEAGIRLSYTPGNNPIRDVPGNDTEVLSRVPVTNNTPDTTAPTVRSLAITSNPGSDQTYAAGDEMEVTVTFSETVEVEGTPQLRLRVGTRTRTAGYRSGTGTVEVVFGYAVIDGDEDSGGVNIEAGRIALNGGTIEDEAENAADLAHGAVVANAGHKVDGVRPAFVSAAMDGASLALTYQETLDSGSMPAPGDFTVEVGGSGRTVNGVSVSGSVVTLTLNPAVEHGDTGIRVSYSPGTDPIRDAVSNGAIALSNRSVTNTTDAPNTAPQITSPSSFDVPENQTVARRLAARDTDPGDEVTGWEIVGGTDPGQFTITSDTGELSFRTAPDFEAPGDNAYEVTVEVRSGAGARELEDEQTFTVRVTDEREPPDVSETPAFSGETAESLTVHWSEPDNTGPPIIDYDVQYREKGTGRFTDGGHEGPGLSLTLDDLEPGTVYEVQVRTTNDEGRSDWSESGEGMTVTPLTVQMASDIEPPVEGPFMVRFIFSEPVRGFSPNDIETGQDPACMDDQNTPVFCDPLIGGLETIDDRIFTASLTPRTDGVAHNYTLTLTVPTGRVSSLTGNKPNEEAMLAVRVAPPEVTLPISAIGLSASAGDSEVTLRWKRPANTGGSPVIRYEYRHAAVGEEWGDWENAAARARRTTVENLINGQEYVFEARAVNALGKGPAETAMEIPVRSTGNGGGGGSGVGGGGGGGGGPARPTANTDPVITTPGPFEVTENQTRVARIEAIDADPGDAIRSYAIAGGADGGRFSIVAHTGVLSFREPPNFEAPADALSTDPPSEAGDNEYIVVVRVASGPVSRDRTVEQAFAVQVTDADRESPEAPEAPRVTLALDASLTVEWAEPENPGPPITGYDVQYREGTTGVFINALHEGTGRTATLTGLEAATLYQVQVRARNEEGTGRWSESGEGWTLAGPAAMLPFSVPDGGGFSVTSRDAGPALRVGYGQVETDAGMTPPAGLAIFGSRPNGILVSEAGVPASAPVLEGRIFAETGGPVRTGLALANPNDTAATIAFFFTDSDGIDSGHDTFTLEPREQIARFLDEGPFNGGSAIEGTFTFTADLPVAVIALRGFVNERSEFLMTTLPVALLAVPTTATVYFPHFAAGGGWTTQVILVNPTHAPISGNVQFFGPGSQTQAAAPATLTLADGRGGSTFSYAIPPRSATRLRTSSTAGSLQVGSVRAVPDTGHTAPAGVSIFTFQKDGTTVSEAGVPASTSGAAFRVYVEASGTPEQPHSVRSGIALTNTSGVPTTVSLELTDLDGTATGSTELLTIPASGHIARFIDEFFTGLPTPFSGILRIGSTAPDIAGVGLRLAINPRNDILVTTTPPVDESAAAAASDLFFPHFVDSGGWTTQFILFSGSPGQTAAGMIRFTGQDGQPLELSVAPTAPPMIP